MLSQSGALLAAVGGAVCFGTSASVQRLAARSCGDTRHVGAKLIGQLFRSPWFVVGVLLDIVGMVASLVAVQALPVYVVEAVLAASVAVAAFISCHFLREPVRPLRWCAVVVLLLALVVVAATAESAGAGRLHGTMMLVPLLGPLLLFGCARAIAARGLRWAGVAFGILSGAAFGMANLTARLLPAPSLPPDGPGVVFVVTVTAWVTVGLVLFGAGVRERDATTVIVGQTLGEAIIPSVIAVALGDRWLPGSGDVAAVAFAVAIAAALVVAVGERSTAVVPSVLARRRRKASRRSAPAPGVG